MTRHPLASLALALGLPAVVSWAGSVQALDHIGGTCVPDSATVREGKYETAGFGVRFGGNNIGKIRLLCLLDDVRGIRVRVTWLSVIDEDGMGEAARVRAHFRHAKFGTNAWIAIGEPCDSNTSNIIVPHKLECQVPRYAASPDTEWYWWDVEIERTDPKVNVEFLGVAMGHL